MAESKQFTSVEEYINSQSEAAAATLRQMIEYIKEAAPDAIEMINYNIPAYALVKGGKREEQIMIAGFNNHIGFYPHPTTMAHFEPELTEYKRAKGSVQFPLSKPLPKDLIIRMVKYRREMLK